MFFHGPLPITMALGWVWGAERVDMVHHSMSPPLAGDSPAFDEAAGATDAHQAGDDTD
jgi:hypothetical protein